MRISERIFILLLESVRVVAAWNHASAVQFSSILKKNDITLVACEFIHTSGSPLLMNSVVAVCSSEFLELSSMLIMSLKL